MGYTVPRSLFPVPSELVRKALYLVASGQITPTELFTNATDPSGPFGDHLRRLLSLLYDKQELI